MEVLPYSSWRLLVKGHRRGVKVTTGAQEGALHRHTGGKKVKSTPELPGVDHVTVHPASVACSQGSGMPFCQAGGWGGGGGVIMQG